MGRIHAFRRFACVSTLIGLVTLSACAGAPRSDVDELTIETSRPVREAYEEFPAVAVAGRDFVFTGALSLALSAPDSARAQSALSAALAVADSVEKLVSPHTRGSEISAINAAAGREAVRMSPWTEAMIIAALEWAERTGGAFDPTVGPLVRVWGFGSDEVEVPNDDRLEAARRLVGWNKVRLDRSAHTVFLTEPGMELDLRALAKGFALDRMREAMMSAGASRGIADFDGDLIFFGPGTAPSANLWTIEVSDPYDPTRSFARLELPPGGFSTSAFYDRAIEIEGDRVGHLLDPRTGYPVRGIASVSVFASEAIVNDILSTALFVMGAEEGLRLAEELSQVEALFVVDAEPGERAEVLTTAGLQRHIEELRPPVHPAETEDW
jgi:thiamine biosynthesis lipoprotein